MSKPILEQLNEMKNVARAKKDLDSVSFLSYVISKIASVGKNDGNRNSTNDEAISAVNRIISDNKKTLELSNSQSMIDSLNLQNDMLKSVLPSMASEDDVRDFLSQKYTGESNMKGYMAGISKEFGAAVDKKMASKVAQEFT